MIIQIPVQFHYTISIFLRGWGKGWRGYEGGSVFVYLIILRWFISFSCWSGRELSQFLFGSGVPPDQENDDGGEQDPGDTATEDEAQHDVSVI